MFTVTYFGLLRVGEATRSRHVIKAKDVHVGTNKKKLMLVLHSSKTHNESSKPQIIKIDAIDQQHLQKVRLGQDAFLQIPCPFQLLQEYIESRCRYRNDLEQFFVFRDGSAVTPYHFNATLKKLLSISRLDETLYSSQSFRSGQASDLSDLGVSIETIHKLGRWKSMAIYTYLHI